LLWLADFSSEPEEMFPTETSTEQDIGTQNDGEPFGENTKD